MAADSVGVSGFRFLVFWLSCVLVGCLSESSVEFPFPAQHTIEDEDAGGDDWLDSRDDDLLQPTDDLIDLSPSDSAHEDGGSDEQGDLANQSDQIDYLDTNQEDTETQPDQSQELDAEDLVEDAAWPEEPLQVVVIADLNGSYGSTTYGTAVHSAIARIVEMSPDLVISVGDMVAGQLSGLDYLAMWEAFHAAVSDPLQAAGIPFAVTPGNHDASGYAAFTEEREIFADEWLARVPEVEFHDATHYPLRYFFSLGPVFFVSLDATRVGPISLAQFDWVEDQLEDGLAYPVRIVFGHLPLFPIAEGRESEVLRDYELEELLDDFGVSAYISGHHHAYYPGLRGDLRLVSVSCLGSGPRRLIGDDVLSPRSFLYMEMDQYGIDVLEAYRSTEFLVTIDHQELPTSVGSDPMTVWRDDIW